ncbi:KPN_02809 family neutral zinc metallopeptidase [Enterovirga sp. CN4-39]|uniref:KPN_02809 family neutral zinc metallopeptidase n=1 Tax=Enterovirga sp. CN4-39 TaxID=3400910 RepID=UPI003C0D6546
MRWEDFRTSDYVEDRRGQGGGGGGFGIPIGRGGGGLGIGTVIVLGLVGWALGIDPRILIGGAEMMTRGGGQSGYERQAPPAPSRTGAPSDEVGRFAAAILGNTEDVWKDVLRAQVNRSYPPTRMVLYAGGTRSGCGMAQSAMGPFYCPLDKSVYLDTSFFQEMQRRFKAGGDFAYAYVIAHEVGHHVQNVLGILPKVQARQREVGEREANQLSVRVELMADCLAGVWAKHSNQRWNAIDESDMQEAVAAAEAIGDDQLQKRGQGRVVPDSFTHGSSAQRVRWLLTGFKSGQVQSCDTFRASRL